MGDYMSNWLFFRMFLCLLVSNLIIIRSKKGLDHQAFCHHLVGLFFQHLVVFNAYGQQTVQCLFGNGQIVGRDGLIEAG